MAEQQRFIDAGALGDLACGGPAIAASRKQPRRCAQDLAAAVER
jgi:hypothetical protein